MEVRVDLELMGPVQATMAGRPVNLGVRKQRLVLAVLALEANRQVEAERLIELLWPRDPPATARGMIHTHVSGLRTMLTNIGAKAAGVWVDREGSGYLLRCDLERIDVHRFRALVADARRSDDERRVAILERALRLWRGPPLTGTASEEVRVRLCASLEEARLTAVEDSIETRLRLGRHDGLLEDVLAHATEHPHRPRLVGGLMWTLHQSGRSAEALTTYQGFRQRLRDELGLDPPASLQELHLAILRADHDLSGKMLPGWQSDPPSLRPDSSFFRPAQLPADLPTFTGRTQELAQLLALFGRTPVGSVEGMAGIGKTSLVVHAAHQLVHHFPDGQLFLNLHGFSEGMPPVDPADALDRMLRALDIPGERIPAQVDERSALLRSALAGRRMLIVLDNAASETQVRPLLPGAPGCLVLITSRTSMTGLVAAEGAHCISLDPLTTAESRDLLARCLGAERVMAEQQAVNEIITACAQLPLALAVLAARAAAHPTFPLSDFATQLLDAGQRLDALDAGDRALQVRAVFSWSHQHLAARDARLFHVLGLHPGPDITAPATASLTGSPATETQRALTELVRTNLIVEHARGRYAFHDLLRAYATELAHTHEAEDRQQAIRRRMLDHYLHTALAADRLLYPHRDPITVVPTLPQVTPEVISNHAQALAWFDSERPVLLAILRLTATWQLAWSLTTYFHRRGYWDDLSTSHHTALEAARRAGDLSGQGHAHRELGFAHIRLGRPAEAETHLQRALDLFVEIGDRRGQARSHLALDWALELQGHLTRALDHAHQALDLFLAIDHPAGQADALNAIGWHYALLGEHPQAITHCERSLALHREIGNQSGEANASHSLGYAHHCLGHHPLSVDHFQQAISLRHELGDRYNEADTWCDLGDAHSDYGDVASARVAWEYALDLLEQLRHPRAEKVRAKLRR